MFDLIFINRDHTKSAAPYVKQERTCKALIPS